MVSFDPVLAVFWNSFFILLGFLSFSFLKCFGAAFFFSVSLFSFTGNV